MMPVVNSQQHHVRWHLHYEGLPAGPATIDPPPVCYNQIVWPVTRQDVSIILKLRHRCTGYPYKQESKPHHVGAATATDISLQRCVEPVGHMMMTMVNTQRQVTSRDAYTRKGCRWTRNHWPYPYVLQPGRVVCSQAGCPFSYQTVLDKACWLLPHDFRWHLASSIHRVIFVLTMASLYSQWLLQAIELKEQRP